MMNIVCHGLLFVSMTNNFLAKVVQLGEVISKQSAENGLLFPKYGNYKKNKIIPIIHRRATEIGMQIWKSDTKMWQNDDAVVTMLQLCVVSVCEGANGQKVKSESVKFWKVGSKN